MRRNPVLYKTLAVGVIVLFVGFGIQPAIANEDISSDLNVIPISENALPDLIIKDIEYGPFEMGWDIYYVSLEILNQGDAYAEGFISIEFKAIRTIFWFFNLYTSKHTSGTRILDKLAPGEKTRITVTDFFGLATFGIYKFYAGINLDKKIPESNYNNNEHMERVITIFHWWENI